MISNMHSEQQTRLSSKLPLHRTTSPDIRTERTDVTPQSSGGANDSLLDMDVPMTGNKTTTASQGDREFEKILSAAGAFNRRLANRPRKGCPDPPRNTPKRKKMTTNVARVASPPASSSSPSSSPPPPPLRPQIICSECDRKFDTYPTLLLHQITFEHSYCRPCYSFYPTPERVAEHREEMHNFSCVQCGSVFVLVTELMYHQRRTGHAYCKCCDGYFMTEESHGKHMAKVHGVDCTSPKSDVESKPDVDAD